MTSDVQTAHAMDLPNEQVSGQAANAAADLADFLRAHPLPTHRVVLCSEKPEGETLIVVPSVAIRFLVDILAELGNGNAVTVAPVHAELTSQQAADILNVSRPYLVKLLDGGVIPFRKVGNRRRVRLMDVLDYDKDDRRRRHTAAADLTKEAQEIGLDY